VALLQEMSCFVAENELQVKERAIPEVIVK